MKHIKRILCAAMSLALTACLCAAPVSAAEEGWKEAYRTVISENAVSWGNVYQLADFDLDGTPELLIGGMPGSGLFSTIEHAFTFHGGAAEEISVPDLYLKLGDSYELYRNDSTGAVRVEGRYVLRSGYDTSTAVTATYIYDGATLSYVTDFGYGKDVGKDVYFIGTDKVSASAYNSAYNSRNDGWTQIDFPVSSLRADREPTSAEIDSLLDGYEPGGVLAVSSSHALQVNGAPVSAAAYTIGGSNYFRLRDLAALLTDTGAKFEVGYDSATRNITLTTGQSYTAIGGELAAGDGLNQLGIPTPSAIYVDGKTVELSGYNIGGSNYFKLRDLGEALGFEVGWDDAARTVSING